MTKGIAAIRSPFAESSAARPKHAARRKAVRLVPTTLQEELTRAAIEMVKRYGVRHLMHVSDVPLPSGAIDETLARRIIHVVSNPAQRNGLEAAGIRAVLVPGYAMERHERLKLAL